MTSSTPVSAIGAANGAGESSIDSPEDEEVELDDEDSDDADGDADGIWNFFSAEKRSALSFRSTSSRIGFPSRSLIRVMMLR